MCVAGEVAVIMANKKDDFEYIAKVNLLFDFYGNLLTEKQKTVMSLYYEENLSLAEIADEFAISRQGVYDTLKNAEKSLFQHEEKLRLTERFKKTEKVIRMTDRIIEELIAERSGDAALIEQLGTVRKAIDEIE